MCGEAETDEHLELQYCCLLNSMACQGNGIFTGFLKAPASIVILFRNSYRIALSSWNSYNEQDTSVRLVASGWLLFFLF